MIEQVNHLKPHFPPLTFQEGNAHPAFAYQPLFNSRMALVVSAVSSLAEQASIRLDEIRGLPLALPVKGYSTRQFLDYTFAKHAVSPVVQLELNDIPTLLDVVRTGHWHTILSMATVAGQAGLRAVPLAGEDMDRQASLVWLASSYRKVSARRLGELLI